MVKLSLNLGASDMALRENAVAVRSGYEGDMQADWEEYGDEIDEVERLKTATEGEPRHEREDLTFTIDLKDLVRKRIESSVSRLREDYPRAYRRICRGGRIEGRKIGELGSF